MCSSVSSSSSSSSQLSVPAEKTDESMEKRIVALYKAAKLGDIPTAKTLLAEKRHSLIALQLLQAGADPDAPDDKDITPLYRIARYRNSCDKMVMEEMEKKSKRGAYYDDSCVIS